MALALSGTSPAVQVNTSSSNDTATNASHIPPGGSGCVELMGWAWNTGGSGNSPATPAASSSDGGTWTLVQHSRRGDSVSPVVDGQCAAWWRLTSSATAQTDTVVAGTNTGSHGGGLKTWTFTGAHATAPVGASAKGSSSSTSTVSVTLNATATGSIICLIIEDWDLKGAMTAGAGTTLTGGGSGNAGTEISYGFLLSSGSTTAGVNYTVNANLGGTSTNVRWIAVEIIPPGGATTVQAAADLAESVTLGATALVTEVASAALSESVTLGATALVTKVATAALSESVTLGATALVTEMASAALTSSIALSAAAIVTEQASASLSGAVALGATATVTEIASAALSESISMGAGAVLTIPALVGLSGSVSLGATATVIAQAAVAMSEMITLGASATTSTPGVASADLVFRIDMTAVATVTEQAHADFGMGVALAAAVSRLDIYPTINLGALFSLSATPDGDITCGREGLTVNELKYQKIQTTAFIDANPTCVTLIPRTRLKTGGGMKFSDLPARGEQRMRIIDQTRPFGPEPGALTGADGKQRKVEYQLLGLWDAEIGLYDYWIDSDGYRWEVIDLLPDMGYERRAQVMRFGESS